MNYEIQFVEDAALPEGNHWALVETPHTIYFYVKRSHLTPAVLEEGWTAFRMRAGAAHLLSA